MKCNSIDRIRRRLGFCNGFNVPLVRTAGGLSLWWDHSATVNILYTNAHLIDTTVHVNGLLVPCHMSWVYSTPYRDQKVDFWRWMENMLTPQNHPWFVGGDFNE